MDKQLTILRNVFIRKSTLVCVKDGIKFSTFRLQSDFNLIKISFIGPMCAFPFVFRF